MTPEDEQTPTGGEWCAAASQERGETLVATASRVERWLLVEHAEAWGPATVPSGRMDPSAARALGAAARAARARLLLIRRATAHRDRAELVGRQVFAVSSLPGQERVLTTHVTDDAELTTLLPPYGTAVPSGWTVHHGPLYLVCTHGRHDRCCALRGRPVARALAEAYGDAVWESSHVGGDRFAANLIVLPDGLYFGRVTAEGAADLVDRLERGQLDPELLRGRSSLPGPVQAAQSFARQRLGSTGRDELALEQQDVLGTNLWRVRLAGGVTVVVRFDPAGEQGQQLLTCDSIDAKRAPAYRLESFAS